jgi:hypothetical protein
MQSQYEILLRDGISANLASYTCPPPLPLVAEGVCFFAKTTSIL